LFKFSSYQKSFKGSQCAGVHMFLKPDGSAEYSLVLLKKKSSKIQIEKRELDISDFDTLMHFVPKSVPVILTIEGKGIVNRRVNTENLVSETEIVSRVLPNAKPAEFYIQKTTIKENDIFLTLARRISIDEILERFEKEKRFVIKTVFGPFSLNHIASLLDEKYEVINGKYGGYRMENNLIKETDMKYQDCFSRYRLEEELLSDQDIIAFATAFSFFVEQAEISLDIEKCGFRNEEFIYKRMFGIMSVVLLLLVFIILMGNLVLYQQYNKKSAELVDQLAVNEDLIYELEKVEGVLKSKEDFIGRSGFLQSSKLSYYADRLAYNLPETIRLTKCDLEPLQKKLKNNEQPEFTNNQVRVAGLTRESTVLNNWIKTINKETWVKDVKVIGYKQEKNSDPGEFEIEIIIK